MVRLTIRARIGLVFLTAGLFAAVLTFVGGQTADRLPPLAGGADAGQLDEKAAEYRRRAGNARRQAAEMTDLAMKARARADREKSPVVKEVWKRNAAQDEVSAKRLSDRADELDRVAKEASDRAARLRGPPTPAAENGTPALPASPASGPSPPAAVPQPEARAAEPPCSAGQPGSEEPLPADEVAGEWLNGEKDGEIVVIQPERPKDESNFLLKGKHVWRGSYNDGKLTFKRYPEVEELGDAPEWAKKAVADKGVAPDKRIEWVLELKAKRLCGAPALEGDWFPGEFRYHQENGPSGETVSQTAAVSGKGRPVAKKYIHPPRIFVVANAVSGAILISSLYQSETVSGKDRNVPLILAVVFDQPQASDSYPISLDFGEHSYAFAAPKLSLTAKPIGSDRRIFMTEAFTVLRR